MNIWDKYDFIKGYLRAHGWKTYPYEMVCGNEGCKHERNRFVDVVGHKNGKIYAFEYKSSGDYLLRALKQIENYRCSFDYVVLIAQIPRHDVSVNPSRGIRIEEILALGAGLWTVEFQKGHDPLFHVVVDPQLQNPIPANREWVEQKFWRYRKSNRTRFGRPPDQYQRRMEHWTQ